jgi:hypothetical protein
MAYQLFDTLAPEQTTVRVLEQAEPTSL